MSPEQEEILKTIATTQQKHDMKLRRIETVLVGDTDFKIKGLVDKVAYHGEKINEFDKDKTKVIAGATVLGTIFGFLSGFIHKIFN